MPASPGAETGGDAAAELRWALEHFHGIGWHGYPDSPCDCPKCQWARRVTSLLAPGAETVEQRVLSLVEEMEREASGPMMMLANTCAAASALRKYAGAFRALLAASSGKTGEASGTCDAEIPGRNDTRCGRPSLSIVRGRSRCVDHLGAGPGRFDRRG